MDPATFHAEINKIVTGHRLDQHPYVKLVNEGSAAREQLKGYPIQHYEMTVRDSAPLSAAAYLKMYGLRPALAEPGPVSLCAANSENAGRQAVDAFDVLVLLVLHGRITATAFPVLAQRFAFL
jgi:hypothetical protein